jgi:hypothetical protein
MKKFPVMGALKSGGLRKYITYCSILDGKHRLDANTPTSSEDVWRMLRARSEACVLFPRVR